MFRTTCLLLLTISGFPVIGDEPKFESADARGKPNGYKAGLSTRYAIWFDDGTWHFRTTTNDKGTDTFTGTIEIVGGRMVDLKPIKVEGKKAKKNLDYASWNPEGTAMKFSFTTGKGFADGFDMKLSDKATAIKFVLKIDGKEAANQVFLGSKNGHPAAATFYLPANPSK